jgi:DNA-directed RNA polymerase specialized sigma24 family protein
MTPLLKLQMPNFRKRLPLDDYVLSKIDFDRFIDSLSSSEAEYVRLEMIEDFYDWEAAEWMDMSVPKVKAVKKAVRAKIEDLATDQEL